MNVFLTFDIEVWCGGWRDLDNAFPKSFERYVYGHSRYGDYALPQTIAILNRHGLKGVFFVEPLFASRFGIQHLETIISLIRGGGHEVQLHLHPEWVNEARQPIIKDSARKRQHLNQYTLDEQTTLIGYGKKMLEAAGSGPISAFRAGSYAANRDTFNALQRNSIYLDWSLNRCFAVSAQDLRAEHDFKEPFVLQGVTTYPTAVMTDGYGRERPAQVTACGFGELRDAMYSAKKSGWGDFSIVSHNFEMLKAGRSEPDWVVVQRFKRLCAFLADHQKDFCVRGMGDDLQLPDAKSTRRPLPRAKWLSTGRRHLEQLARRWL